MEFFDKLIEQLGNRFLAKRSGQDEQDPVKYPQVKGRQVSARLAES